MIKSVTYILTLILILEGAQGWTQNKKTSKTVNIDQTQASGTSKSKEYNKAEALAIEANSLLLKGEVKLADSLIKKSVDIYPVMDVAEYAKTAGALPDIAGANGILDRLIDRVRKFPESTLYMREPFPSKLKDGIMVAEIKRYGKGRALFNFIVKSFEVNKELGERQYILKTLLVMSEPVLEPLDDKAPFDYEALMQPSMAITLAMYQKDFDKALKLMDELPINEITKHSNQSTAISIYTAMGNLSKALELTENYKGIKEFQSMYHIFQFNLNALKGENELALDHWEKVKAEFRRTFKIEFEPTNGIYYTLALIELNKKNYPKALDYLKTSLSLRSKKDLTTALSLVEAWDLYKAFGDAYAGLKEFQRARDNYNISLLYYPEHQPAIDALSKLEVNYVNEAASDKTPPTITITEPFANRGLKVAASGGNVMVRGVAKDQSGISEVSLNGQKIYSQQGGDFWGEINLGAGLHSIEITAIDMAGNKAVKTIQVEKSSTAIAQADPIAVVEKEGKNYALFVAAQNYTDSAIPSLENPVADAVKLKLILKNNYNFADANLISLFNPETDGLRRQLLELTNLLQPEDKLVIFYAGHGIWVDKEKRGYWLLTDAKRNDSNSWLPNKDVLELIAKIPARHTLLITDACFSGSVFKTRGLGAGASLALQEMDNKISRVAITSGNDTEVPDESVFMKYLVKALTENKEKYLSAQKMFINQIIEAVMTETKTEPRYGTLELAGHVGGDFVFSKK